MLNKTRTYANGSAAHAKPCAVTGVPSQLFGKLISILLAVLLAMAFTSPVALAVTAVPQEEHYFELNTPAFCDGEVTATFFIAIYTDAEKYPSSLSELERTIQNRYTSGITIADSFDATGISLSGGKVKIDDVAGKGESIAKRILISPTDDDISARCSEYSKSHGVEISYDPSTQKVVWYVVKDESDGWHIDGILVPKSIVPIPDPEPEPEPEPEPKPEPQPLPSPDPQPTPQVDPTPIIIEEVVEPTVTTVTATTAVEPAELIEDDAAPLAAEPQDFDPFAGTVFSLSNLFPLDGSDGSQGIPSIDNLPISDEQATAIRVASVVLAGAAIGGLGVVGVGGAGTVKGLGTMDSTLRRLGRLGRRF